MWAIVAGTFYMHPESFCVYKILVALEYSSASIKVPSFELGETNKSV